MAGTINIIRGEPLKINYFPYIYFDNAQITYSTAPIDTIIEPGIYSIPADQRDNLNWFYDNNFRFNAYGRLHAGRMMSDNEPDTVVVI
jgi:hypothetical protein